MRSEKCTDAPCHANMHDIYAIITPRERVPGHVNAFCHIMFAGSGGGRFGARLHYVLLLLLLLLLCYVGSCVPHHVPQYVPHVCTASTRRVEIIKVLVKRACAHSLLAVNSAYLHYTHSSCSSGSYCIDYTYVLHTRGTISIAPV